MTGSEIAINLTLYLLYGYSSALVFSAISLFGYVGIHAKNLVYLRTYVFLSLIVAVARIIEFMALQKTYYILVFINVYSLSVCFYVNRYIKNVSEVVIGNPVTSEDQEQVQDGPEYKIAVVV
jgi:hypothetical protein